jgi:hypothetical protein
LCVKRCTKATRGKQEEEKLVGRDRNYVIGWGGFDNGIA